MTEFLAWCKLIAVINHILKLFNIAFKESDLNRILLKIEAKDSLLNSHRSIK